MYGLFGNRKRKMKLPHLLKTNETRKAKVFWRKHKQGKV